METNTLELALSLSKELKTLKAFKRDIRYRRFCEVRQKKVFRLFEGFFSRTYELPLNFRVELEAATDKYIEGLEKTLSRL